MVGGVARRLRRPGNRLIRYHSIVATDARVIHFFAAFDSAGAQRSSRRACGSRIWPWSWGAVDSPFFIGKARVEGDELIFFAATEDGSGADLHSGLLHPDGVIRGQTLSVGRDFLMGWGARPSPE